MSTAKRSILSPESGLDAPLIDFAEASISPNGELLEQPVAFAAADLDFSFAGVDARFNGDDGLDF